MAEQFSLGRHGKLGEIDFSKLKSGITKQDLGIEEGSVLASIFDSINQNNEGDSAKKLDREELNNFLQIIKDLAGNERLSEREAKKYKIDNKKLGKNNEELITFINKLADLTKGVQKVNQQYSEKSELITFEDGHTEEIFSDGSKIITVSNGVKTITTKKDKNGNITEKTIKDGDTKTKTEYKNNQIKETKITPNTKEITNYKDNAPTDKVISYNNGTIEEYKYENNDFVLKKRINKSNNEETHFDGSKETNITQENGTQIVTVKDNGKLVSKTETRTNEENQLEEKKTVYEGENFTETFSIDKKEKYQKKVIDGKEYYVEYDKDGYTTGIIVQNREKLSTIATKFGCTVKELIQANYSKKRGNPPNVFFNVGEEIRIPRKLEADDPALQNRKTKQEAINDYIKDEEIREQQRIQAEQEARIAEEETAITETEANPEVTPTQKEINLQKESAKLIVEDLKKAISGWNDHDAIQKALDKIDTPIELQEVENLLAAEGYKANDLYSSIENFINAELQRVETDFSCEELESIVQKWIDNGVLNGDAANQAQARLAARIICDGGDGMGTDPDKIKKGIYMIKAPTGAGKEAAKKVYEEVNKIIANHNTFYGIGTKCENLIDYLGGELEDSEIKYLRGILAETNAIQDTEKAEAVQDLVREAVSGMGTSIKDLKQVLKAVNSNEDRLIIEEKLKEYCESKGIKPLIDSQDYLQAILYDECDTSMGFGIDHKEIRKYNEELIQQNAYSAEDITRIRAEQAALQILEGDFDNIKDAIAQIKDKAVLNKLNQLLKTKGYDNLNAFLNEKLNSTESDIINAELASNKVLDDNTSVEIAFRLIRNKDFNTRAMGLKAIRNENVAKLVNQKLKEVNSSLSEVYEQFNKEKEEYKTNAAIWDGLAFILGDFAEYISDKYQENTDSSDNTYIETNNSITLTHEQEQAYTTARNDLEARLAELKKAYEETLNDQGFLSDYVNRICKRYNLGTSRDEINARIEHDTETLRLLDIAAQGKLGKVVNGKTIPVNFEEVFSERQAIEFNMVKTTEVAQHQEKVGALHIMKDMISSSWTQLEDATNSNDSRRLTVAIYDTLRKISQLFGQELSLESYGYSLNSSSIIIDSNGKPVDIAELKEIVQQLKLGLIEFANSSFGTNLTSETNADSINKALEEIYQNEIEGFKDKYKEAWGQEPPDELLNDYISTIETGKMGINIIAAIGAAIAAPLTGGGSLATFLGVSAQTGGAIASGIGVAVTSMSLNALENSTDADGYTNSEWTADAEQAIWDGIGAALGAKIGIVAEAKILPKGLEKARVFCNKLFKNPSLANKAATLVARAEAAGFEISSDSVQSVVQMFAQEGKIDSDAFWHAFAMSLIGNAAGHAWSARTEIKADVDSSTPKVSDTVDSPAPSETPTLDRATSNGEAPSSSVKIGREKADKILEEISEVANNPTPEVDNIIKKETEIDAIQDRKARRKAQQDLQNAIEKLSPADRKIYEKLHYEGLQKKVSTIFDRHNSLSATDVRVISEYIQKTDDKTLLLDLRDQLRNKELSYGGITANYKTLDKAIDYKIEIINTTLEEVLGAEVPEINEPKVEDTNVDKDADTPLIDEVKNRETNDVARAPKVDEAEVDAPNAEVPRIEEIDPLENAAIARTQESVEKIKNKLEELIQNNFDDIEALKHLTPQERQLLIAGLKDDFESETFLILINGGKPSEYLNGSEEFIEIIKKLNNNKLDVITRNVQFDDGNIRNHAFILNKEMVKTAIAENKELFTARLELRKDASIDEIYQNIISEDGAFLKSAGLADGHMNDITGIVLGYPKTDSLIFELESRIPGKAVYQERYHTDLTIYKQKLVNVLYSENSPYKNMSDEFKANLAKKINSIEKVQGSTKALGADVSCSYPFFSFVNDQTELNQIRKKLDEVAQKLDEINTNSNKASRSDAPNAEAPKVDEPKIEDTATRADRPETKPNITPQQKMEMGQIGNSILRAKNSDDLKKLQAWLDKMPECPQKTNLQNQLNAKQAEFSTPKVSKFGTYDQPNYYAMFTAKTKEEVEEALEFINKIPDTNPQKKVYKQTLEEKLTKLNDIKSPFDEVWNWNIDSELSTEFIRNKNAQTNIRNLSADNILVCGTFTGYTKLSDTPGKNAKSLFHDIRIITSRINTKSYALYNPKLDVTIIGIHCCDGFRRPGNFNISLKGQVSENDAVELIKVLDSKKLLPKNANGDYSLQDYNAPQALSLGEKIRQETADYFNNLSINAGANAEAKPNITRQQKMEMGQIGNSILRAKNSDDLKKLQAWLDKMPECPQKTNLQNQLNTKQAEFSTPKVKNKADVDVKSTQNKSVISDVEIEKERVLARDKKIKTLESNYHTYQRKMNINGKMVNVTIYDKSGQGSNKAYWLKDNSTGELYYYKENSQNIINSNKNLEHEGKVDVLATERTQARNASEVLAAELYNLAGVNGPKLSVVRGNNNECIGIISKFENYTEIPPNDALSSIREGFVTDCWLGNRDALKTGNVLMSNGEAVRTDVGGSLCFRAQGKRKIEFRENVDELTSFFVRPDSLSKKYIKDMSYDELLNSLSHVTKISDKQINDLVDKYTGIKTNRPPLSNGVGVVGYTYSGGIQNPQYLKETLIARRDYIARFEEICKANPMKQGESMTDYMTRIANITPRTEYSLDFDSERMKISERAQSSDGLENFGQTTEANHTLGEHLTPSQKRLLDNSYNAYNSSKSKRYKFEDTTSELTTDHMVHTTSPKYLEKILSDGLLSREFHGNATAGYAGLGIKPGTRTPMCADVFEIQQDSNIAKYLRTRTKANGEANFIHYDAHNDTGPLIVFNKKAIDPEIMNNSFMVSKANSSILHQDGNMSGYTTYTSHRAIPVGIPANAIEKIVLPTGTDISRYKKIIIDNKLTAKIFDSNGNLLFDPSTANSAPKQRSARFGL